MSLLECWQPGLETIINSTFDETKVCINSEIKLEIHRILEGFQIICKFYQQNIYLFSIILNDKSHNLNEGLLQQFMHSKTNDPAHAIILGRYLNTFGPFLKCFPDSVGGVVNKLFELLTSLPLVLSVNTLLHNTFCSYSSHYLYKFFHHLCFWYFFARIHLQTMSALLDYRFVHHLYGLLKLLIKVFFLI